MMGVLRFRIRSPCWGTIGSILDNFQSGYIKSCRVSRLAFSVQGLGEWPPASPSLVYGTFHSHPDMGLMSPSCTKKTDSNSAPPGKISM